MRQISKSCLIAALALFSQAAIALEIRSAATHGVILYDRPANDARKVFVLSRGTPLEVFAEQGDWARVRDQSGALAWLHKRDLSSQRTVQVIKPAVVYREANAQSEIAFRANTGLLLNLQENTKTGWVRVKHRDGANGFIRIEDIWGL